MSHMNLSRYTYQCVVSHQWVTSHMNESCDIWMSEVTWMSHVDMWMRQVTHVNHACHIHESCHVWMSQSAHINQSYHAPLPFAPYEWFPLLSPPSPLNRHHTRAIFENSLCTVNAGFQISGSFSTIKASCPSPPLTLPRPPSFVGILLLVILGLPFRKLSASKKKRQTLSTWHGHTGRFKDNQKTRTMPTKWGWIQVFDGLSPKYCNLYVLAEFV